MTRTALWGLMALLAATPAAFADGIPIVTNSLGTVTWVEYSPDPVYSPGKAYYPTVLKQGNTYTMWSDGDSGVQVATSNDGITWTPGATVTGLSGARHTVVENIGGTYRM